MREKDNGEKLLDELLDMVGGSAAGLMYTDAATVAYQLAGTVVHEIDTVKEENVTLKKRIAELEAQAAVGRRAVLALRALEWSRSVIDRNVFLGTGCIECGRDRRRGHTDKCALAAILRDAGGVA